VNQQVVRQQLVLLKKIHDRLEKLGKKKPALGVTDKIADQILKDFRAPAERKKQYLHRLRYGLNHYYLRHYHPSTRHTLDE
jgi:hypothetical protein